MVSQYKVGQYCSVKMGNGRYTLCRILAIYEPNVPGIWDGKPYVNKNEDKTFHIQTVTKPLSGWLGPAPKAFFKSRLEAKLWFAKTEIKLLNQELKRARNAHQRSRNRLSKIRKVLASL